MVFFLYHYVDAKGSGIYVDLYAFKIDTVASRNYGTKTVIEATSMIDKELREMLDSKKREL